MALSCLKNHSNCIMILSNLGCQCSFPDLQGETINSPFWVKLTNVPLGGGGLRVLLEVIAVKWCKSGLIRSQASPNCPVGGPNAGGGGLAVWAETL